MRDLQIIIEENKQGKRLSKPMDPNAALISELTGHGQSAFARSERADALKRRQHLNNGYSKAAH